MKKTYVRVALALLLALSMCLALCQCGGDGEAPGSQDENAAGGYTVDVTPSAENVELGGSVTARVAVRGDGKFIAEPDAAGLKLVWTADPADVDFAVSPSGVTQEIVTPRAAGTFTVTVTLEDAAGGALASASFTLNVTEPEPEEIAPEPVNAQIYVPFVTAKEDFIRGTDVSSLLAVLNSGARFKDWEGNSLGESVEENGMGFMKLLADTGVNWIRIRVWNDPYDAEGRSYGGGGNDLNTAVTIGGWATRAGMRVLIDFHYSDFWADPAKQKAPKAWLDMDLETKTAALSQFTTDSLNTLLDAGVDVGMVQVGNETTNGICGESDWANMGKLFAAGCDAVHAVAQERGREILAAIHFTNPERGNFDDLARNLKNNNVNYDVFATSYYPEWHGTIENLTRQLTAVAQNYGKRVLVAETSCPYTYEDGDGNGAQAEPNGYPVSVQGQASEFAAVAKAVRSVGAAGMGLFYWENAWIPAVNISGLEGAEREAAIAENERLWAEYGTGWASEWAGSYDPDDAGQWWGGPAMDNKAMFDFDGNPLESLKVYTYMRTGTTGFANDIYEVPDLTAEVMHNGQLILPDSAHIAYVDGTEADLPITWDEASLAAVDMTALGSKFTVSGVISDGQYDAVIFCTVSVVTENLLKNGAFEDGNTGYDLTGWPGDGVNNKNSADTTSGAWNLHFWNAGAINGAVASQTVTLEPGDYVFSLYGQGGDMGENDVFIFADVAGERKTESFELTGYLDWKNPSIRFTVTEKTDVTVGVSVTAGAGAWGTFDDWTLYSLD